MENGEQNKPSWLRKIPNCCESCIGWEKDSELLYVGRCTKSDSLNCGEKTDSRERCPVFVRKEGT